MGGETKTQTRPALLVKMDPKFHSLGRHISLSMFWWLHCPLPIWSPALPTLEFNRHLMSPTLGNTTSSAPPHPSTSTPHQGGVDTSDKSWLKRNQKFNKAHIRTQWDSKTFYDNLNKGNLIPNTELVQDLKNFLLDMFYIVLFYFNSKTIDWGA